MRTAITVVDTIAVPLIGVPSALFTGAAIAKAERYRPLVAQGAVAQQDYADAAASAQQAKASIAQTRAALLADFAGIVQRTRN